MRTNMRTLYTLLGGFAFFAASLHGQTPRPAAPPDATAAPAKEIVLTATTANVKESGTPVTIRLFRWSTDEERTALIAAFNAPAAARPGGSGRAGVRKLSAAQNGCVVSIGLVLCQTFAKAPLTRVMSRRGNLVQLELSFETQAAVAVSAGPAMRASQVRDARQTLLCER